MINSIELPPPYEDEAVKIAKELEEARKMIELLQAEKKRDEEKERKKELKEYAMALEKRNVRTHNIDIFSRDYIFWEYLDTLDETFIFLSRYGNLLLTDRNLYITKFPSADPEFLIQIHNKNDIMLRPLYTFDKPLTVKDLTMFNNNGFVNWFYNIVSIRCDNMIGISECADTNYTEYSHNNMNNMRRRLHYIELMLTTIPGSYKNKGWENIGGFLGVYINDMKGLFQPYPPMKEQ